MTRTPRLTPADHRDLSIAAQAVAEKLLENSREAGLAVLVAQALQSRVDHYLALAVKCDALAAAKAVQS